MSEFFDLLDRLHKESPVREVAKAAPTAPGRSLVVENLDTLKTYLTVPLETASLARSDFLMQVTGRLVEAEKANLNGAFWTTADLQFGLPSVVTGPVNWLHQEHKILGVLSSAQMVDRESAATIGVGPHIRAEAAMWSYLYPAECDLLEEKAAEGKAFFSMECVSREVACESGCAVSVPYQESKSEKACEHIRNRTGIRRFVDPIFQGAGIIVPPTAPGWANAHIEVVREAAARMEATPQTGEMFAGDENLVAQLLAFISQGCK